MRVLLLDDQPHDAELLLLELKRSGLAIESRYVSDEPGFTAALDWPPDVILADYSMPGFSAPRALALLKSRHLDIPFIVVTGSVGEETAVNILRSGAADYLLKDRPARVAPAIERALEERRLRNEAQAHARRLREAEERTRFALDASGVGTWEADLLTGQVVWSETLERLHGLAPGSFAGTLQAFIERIHPEDRSAVAGAIQNPTSQEADSHLTYRALWPDGTTRWISGTGKTFFDDSGRPVRAAGVGSDVTDRRLLEEQYRQSQKMEAIGQPAGGVAHDFNNLLTVIQGFAAMLAEDVPEVADRVELQQINIAAQRATLLTRQLLAFSRRQILDVVVFDVAQTLREIEPMLRRLIGEQIDFEVRTPEQPALARADRGQIEQVILNLVVNARDAMPAGGSLLCHVSEVVLDEDYVREHHDAATGRHVRLSVADAGEGIAESNLPRIFEPFFTTKSKDKGTGLGLSTVYGIVQQSGGHISVQSTLGRGTTFSVYLPVAAADAVAAEPAAEVTTEIGEGTILVAEDDQAIRELVEAVLGRRGFTVLLAANPGDALRIAREEPGLALLLTDVIMPQMSGKELADAILTIHPHLPVLFMSGYTDDAIGRHGVLQPGIALLEKPFTPDELYGKVQEVLTRPRAT